ncbi:MAG: hypothetical protein AAF577_16595 [Pseudomonadota bacterium]
MTGESRWTLRQGLCFGSALIILTLSGAAPAQAFNDPDWPCQQRKVRQLSWGQMWTGPALPDSARAWRDDETIDRLVAEITPRRTPIEVVPGLIADVAASAQKTRDERLTALFAGVFARIDQERAQIVDGISRLAKRERERSARIDAMRTDLVAMRDAAVPEDFDALDAIEALEDDIAWETRIYDDRRRSFQFVCESPVLLEKRAFALARIIQGALEGS